MRKGVTLTFRFSEVDRPFHQYFLPSVSWNDTWLSDRVEMQPKRISTWVACQVRSAYSWNGRMLFFIHSAIETCGWPRTVTRSGIPIPHNSVASSTRSALYTWVVVASVFLSCSVLTV